MMGEEAPRPRPIWHKGETVRIKSGPFVDTVGRIEEVNSQRQTLIVMVNLLGRETPVEVDFLSSGASLGLAFSGVAR
jgi:transcriptional antiterminator NusG